VQGSTLSYHWANVVPGFDIPVRVQVPGLGTRLLRPTEAWQSLEASPRAGEFERRRELLCHGLPPAVRLGVISDTHGMLRPQVFEIFKEVDHILHGGDVGRPDLLVELQALAPVTAVYGNSDGLDIRARLPQVAEVELDGFQIVVTHGDQFGSPIPPSCTRPSRCRDHRFWA